MAQWRSCRVGASLATRHLYCFPFRCAIALSLSCILTLWFAVMFGVAAANAASGLCIAITVPQPGHPVAYLCMPRVRVTLLEPYRICECLRLTHWQFSLAVTVRDVEDLFCFFILFVIFISILLSQPGRSPDCVVCGQVCVTYHRFYSVDGWDQTGVLREIYIF